MKTQPRKAELSLKAMLYGWVACNPAFWLGSVLSKDIAALQNQFQMKPLLFALFFAAIIAWYTGIVVMAAWLLVFLPVDLCVPQGSWLRRPKTAALCGFMAAFVALACLFIYGARSEIAFRGFWRGVRHAIDPSLLPYFLGACATGTVAAYSRARMDETT